MNRCDGCGTMQHDTIRASKLHECTVRLCLACSSNWVVKNIMDKLEAMARTQTEAMDAALRGDGMTDDTNAVQERVVRRVR